MRVEHDYDRGGALAYLAAYDVHRGTVIGRCAPTTGIEQFEALVEQVMNSQPYATAKRVFWVVDNGSSHRGQTAIERMVARWPTCVLVHTPVHASWLNQVEIFFSVVQRTVVSPNDFTDLSQVEQRLADFEHRYNATATPFDWTFTADDLDDLQPPPRRVSTSTMSRASGGDRASRSSLVTTSVSPARQAASASRRPGRTRLVPVMPWST